MSSEQNPFYIAGLFFREMQAHNDSTSVDEAVINTTLGAEIEKEGRRDPLTVKLRVMALLEACDEIFSEVDLPSSRLERGRETIKRVKGVYLTVATASHAGPFKAAMVSQIDHFETIGDSIQGKVALASRPFDRKAFLVDTNSLIDEVSTSDMPLYQRDALLMKLRAVRRITVECVHLPDIQIRNKVKSIYSDFAIEFQKNDRLYEKLNEKILRWMKSALTPAMVGLALTADLSTVVPLLEGPK